MVELFSLLIIAERLVHICSVDIPARTLGHCGLPARANSADLFLLLKVLFSLFKNVMSFDGIKDFFSPISPCCLFDHLSKGCQLFDGIGDFLSEPQNEHPDNEKEEETCAEDYNNQFLKLLVDF